MPIKIKIGTRESQLALWQAEFVKKQLSEIGVESELVLIKSDGELNLTSPLYEMGVQGIFTKALDIALLQKEIDIAVHSLKDVPTQLAKGLQLAAIPKRGNHKDVLVYKNTLPDNQLNYTVATSSLRRSAQWLHRYKTHKTEVLRGNINTRIKKLNNNQNWHGAMFAAAGIERINLDVPNILELDWMISAPAQGALGIVARTESKEILEICKNLNDNITEIETTFERAFLRKLMGGCSMPIGGFASIKNEELKFTGCVLTINGEKMSKVEVVGNINNSENLLKEALEKLLDNGGAEILESFNK
ncbi:MAG: hydroxymethylbilane synthase [Bacteroidia bacterium]